MLCSTIRKNLKINDILVDIDGKDRIGFGKGIILKFYSSGGMLVKFKTKELPIFVSDTLFCYDREGKKGALRCKIFQEIKEKIIDD
jgi:hypothetical protein